jgi:thiol-disulfide isomerase/thioredoxin
MHYPYRILQILPRVFCVLLLLAMPAVAAETVPILPQFQAYATPRSLPSIRFMDAKGTQKTMADYRGQWVLLNLWATWCAPCRKEMPQLDSLQEVFAETNFRILPLSIDSSQTAPKIFTFYHDHQIKNLPILNDPSGMTMAALKPRGLPSSWLIAPDGRAVGEVIGYARWDSDAAGNLIEMYLQRK